MTPQERKAENERKIRAQGIAVNEWLPLLPSEDGVKLRSFEELCSRAVAALLMIQLAIDTGRGEYGESFGVISEIIDKFGVKDALNETERRVCSGTADQQAVVNTAWEYECYWAVVWALGLISGEELMNVTEICDCDKAIRFVSQCKGMEDFKAQCSMRSTEEILDMIDYFYRIHWACVEHRVRPGTPIAGMNEEIVMERRRGLEWLISEEDDWFDISLDT